MTCVQARPHIESSDLECDTTSQVRVAVWHTCPFTGNFQEAANNSHSVDAVPQSSDPGRRLSISDGFSDAFCNQLFERGVVVFSPCASADTHQHWLLPDWLLGHYFKSLLAAPEEALTGSDPKVPEKSWGRGKLKYWGQ